MPNRFLFFLLLFPVFLPAQFLTQGPVWGAVTHQSAKVYLRAPGCTSLSIDISEDSTFLRTSREFAAVSFSPTDSSTIILLDALEPATRYFARIRINGRYIPLRASFLTFPEPGTRGQFTFATGSCQETENMKVFGVIPKHDPWFLLHTGDFTYPDYQIRPDYSADYPTVAYSYHRRYDEKVMKEMLHTLPVDYIYDDNDYVGSSGGRYYKNSHNTRWAKGDQKGRPSYEMDCNRFPDFWRRNVIRGYDEFFPHYPLPDTTEAIHHSFRFANAEFFFLDRNSAKVHPQSDAFRYDSASRRWKFEPPPDYELYGQKQMDWLKSGLKNSGADWKFIVSGVPFNIALREVIADAVKIQNLHAKGFTGFHLATGFAYYWAGHPREQDDFMEWLEREKIENVIAISGDTHHNVMDDGTNSVIPEMNASGMSVSSTELAYYVNLVGKGFGLYNYKKKVWNRGGNGLGNSNFKNAFGKVTIVGNEYVEMSIVDEDNQVIAEFRVPHTSRTEAEKKVIRKWGK